MNTQLLAECIAIELYPLMGPKGISFDTTVELIVRVVKKMKDDGII